MDDLNYVFCREQGSLRTKLDYPAPTRGRNGTPKRWVKRTPAMAAGITDYKWTIAELMTYPTVALKPYC